MTIGLDLGADYKVYGSGMALTISALAEKFGLKTDTLRYYERLGLMWPPERTTAGYRLYNEPAQERLTFIRSAQRMGLRLGDIKELLDISDLGQCPCGHTRALVQRRLAEVRAEIRQLRVIQKQLLDLQVRNDQCLDAAAGEWSCIAGFTKGGGR